MAAIRGHRVVLAEGGETPCFLTGRREMLAAESLELATVNQANTDQRETLSQQDATIHLIWDSNAARAFHEDRKLAVCLSSG